MCLTGNKCMKTKSNFMKKKGKLKFEYGQAEHLMRAIVKNVIKNAEKE